jgi:hypothetical protein
VLLSSAPRGESRGGAGDGVFQRDAAACVSHVARWREQGFLQRHAFTPGEVLQPALVAVAQRQWIAAGVIAARDAPGVVERAAKYDITELRIVHRAKARLLSAG